MYALVSIVWFAAINLSGADSGLGSIVRVVLVADSPALLSAMFMSPRKASFVFSCPWLALVAFHAQEYKWHFLALRLVVLVCEHLEHTFHSHNASLWFQKSSS